MPDDDFYLLRVAFCHVAYGRDLLYCPSSLVLVEDKRVVRDSLPDIYGGYIAGALKSGVSNFLVYRPVHG